MPKEKGHAFAALTLPLDIMKALNEAWVAYTYRNITHIVLEAVKASGAQARPTRAKWSMSFMNQCAIDVDTRYEWQLVSGSDWRNT